MIRPLLGLALLLSGASARAQGGGLDVSDLCQASWEEKPGTTDYTLIDPYSGKPYARPDRPASQTLQGLAGYTDLPLCERARLLKGCFEKAVSTGGGAAEAVQAWAARRKLDPVRVLMALAAQETQLGGLSDHCRRGVCNGIGMMQIITAISPEGSLLDNDDPRWDGITFNILTNLGYSLRLVADKIRGGPSLHTLAACYNGTDNAESYAMQVRNYYEGLKRCGL